MEDTAPVVEDTAAVTDAATETTDYAPGATGVAGAGSQKMVEDGGFLQELKALIAKYEGTTDAEPEKKDENLKRRKSPPRMLNLKRRKSPPRRMLSLQKTLLPLNK